MSFSVVGPAQAKAKNTTAEDTNGQVVFTVYDNSVVSRLTADYALSNVQNLQTPNTYSANTNSDPVQVATNMNLDSRVKAADPNYTLSLLEGAWTFDFDSGSVTNGGSSPHSLALYHSQPAWSQTNLAAIQTRTGGAGVIVAVLDTGVDYTHPDLQGHLLNKGYSPLDGGDGMDANGHGTFVAGLIAWVAPQAKILPVRVLDANGKGTLSSFIKGLQYALSQGATVINMSFSTTQPLDTLSKMSKDLTKSGVVLVGAAGNTGSNQANYPAALDEVIGLGATDTNSCRASFSNYGDYISLAAPGVNIYSTYRGGGYAHGSGTSFSTAILSGAAVLYKSLHPGGKSKDTRAALQKAVVKFPSSCGVSELGAGQLDFSQIN